MMKNPSLLRLAALLMAVLALISGSASAIAEVTSINPLIDPQVITEYTKTKDDFVNILLLGIDYGASGNWGSGRKTRLEDCHTDAVMVVSINLDQEKISLVSLPRDTFTYVPGVHGIYKLNAAINCAEDLKQGTENVRAAVSWLLGGIKIHYYVAVDMNTMVALGDAVGGVDFDVDMSYEGNSGNYYHAGMQHLDGKGIMDYVRARKNATQEANDIGRTGRQRRMMTAIFSKLLSELKRGNLNILNDIYAITEDKQWNIFKNADRTDLLDLMGKVLLWDADSVRSGNLFSTYVLTGPYEWGMTKWLFTFTDQQNRLEVLKEVYGIDAAPLPFVSEEYSSWLLASNKSYTLEDGFMNARYIRVARKILDYAHSLPFLFSDQQEAVDALIAAYDAAVVAFDQASTTMSRADTQALQAAVRAMTPVAEAAVAAIEYPETVRWSASVGWWRDPVLFDYIINWE